MARRLIVSLCCLDVKGSSLGTLHQSLPTAPGRIFTDNLDRHLEILMIPLHILTHDSRVKSQERSGLLIIERLLIESRLVKDGLDSVASAYSPGNGLG